jgi:hypothetical protein
MALDTMDYSDSSCLTHLLLLTSSLICAVAPVCRQVYDAFLIVHGTDTMAYTASALSLMLQGFKKPILLTGEVAAAAALVPCHSSSHLKHAKSVHGSASCCKESGSPHCLQVSLLLLLIMLYVVAAAGLGMQHLCTAQPHAARIQEAHTGIWEQVSLLLLLLLP